MTSNKLMIDLNQSRIHLLMDFMVFLFNRQTLIYTRVFKVQLKADHKRKFLASFRGRVGWITFYPSACIEHRASAVCIISYQFSIDIIIDHHGLHPAVLVGQRVDCSPCRECHLTRLTATRHGSSTLSSSCRPDLIKATRLRE